MKRRIVGLGVIAMAALVAGPMTQAHSASPIFGSAAVTPLTTAQNKTVVGKGYYADYYGSYGISFADYAIQTAQYGDYASAAAYANYAYQYFSVADYYQYAGQ